MIRNWLGIVVIGVLSAACAETSPPPPALGASETPPALAQPADPAAVPAEGGNTTGFPSGSGVLSYNLPPNAIDMNPPGTPSYVITPGDNIGRRNSQIPRPGGNPAF